MQGVILRMLNSSLELESLKQYNKEISKNKKKAFIWFRKSAKAGNVTAQNQFAYCYSEGVDVKKDKKKPLNGFKNLLKEETHQHNLILEYIIFLVLELK